ncbi:chromosome-associated kinesin kif4a [Plakobranchus ocellatus]|uniref:Chromosome-associated kinesin kif4a n=1 Tax=Plakobranchus ocellatus TaxID=259542 RepID=A0AAV4DS55_9GAST|nr:chromosome-associated kinesin kif4a [Plakobranchus ocellatus]
MVEDKSKTIPVLVALRCRPLIKKELDEGCESCLQTISGEPQVVLGKDRAFTYDFAFGPTDPQADVYNHACRTLVERVFKGYNATILAYGQTGSGKTFTMGGYEASLEGDEDAMGVIPRILREVFQIIVDKKDFKFAVRVSYLEIYKEDLIDLLCAPSERAPLPIREESNGGIKIHGSREVPVTNFEETMNLLSQGATGRTTGATAMNNTSSRSHAIFTLHIDQENDIGDCSKVKFHMVDLAGSERTKRTMAEGERLKEGININKGLLALGNVISALGEEGDHRRKHIPYRDSKLTRILQDSLGGNSHTLMIACVSPADSNIEETLNTLRYADRARKIKNKPIINRDPQTAEIMRLKTLVQDLQNQLHGGIVSAGMMSTMSSTSTLNSTTSTVTGGTTTSVFPQPSNNAENLKLKERVKELEQENYELTKQLQSSVAQSSRTLSQMLRLEASNERLKMRVNQVKDYVGIDLELLSSSIDVENNPQAKAELEKLHKLTGSITTTADDDDDDDDEDDAEESDEEDSDEKDKNQMDEEATDDTTMPTPTSCVETKKHAIRQAELQRELGEINRILNTKQALAQKIEAAEEQMETMKTKYEMMLSEFKTKTLQLERENEQLTSNLVDAKSKANASKVAEQRRHRLKELEQQMAQLKKKMAEQSKIVKMKETTDKQMGRLGSEILLLKQQRVKLMKQMKEEVSSFQKWKKEKEKQVSQLQLRERRREVEMTKMKKQFEQQQAVQKRRTAEAMAANKRLLDALAKQKEVESERSSKLEKYNSSSIGNRVRQWLSRELEVKVSMVEAQFHLDQLMDERKRLTQHRNELRADLENGPITEKFSWLGENGDYDDINVKERTIKEHITSTERDIGLINSQIQELQQKIVDADQESKGTSTWQSLHTMNEAKCALKFLLDQAINARSENLKVQGELRSVQDRDREEEDELKRLKAQVSQEKVKFQRELDKLKQDHDEKVIFLLRSNEENCSTPNKKMERFHKQFMKSVEPKLQQLEKLEQKLSEKESECAKLQEHLLLYRGGNMKHFPDIESMENVKKEETMEQPSDVNSTFLVNSESEPASKLMNTTFDKSPGDVDIKVENTSNEENMASRAYPKRKNRRGRTVTIDTSTASDESTDKTISPTSLKRRSEDDPDKMDTSRYKRGRRTLLPMTGSSYFGALDDV